MLVGLHDRQAIREKVQLAPAKPAAATPCKAGHTGCRGQVQQQQPAANQPNAQQGAAQQKPAGVHRRRSALRSLPAEQQRARPDHFEFRSEKWEEVYGARVDEMIAVLKTANVPVLMEFGVPPCAERNQHRSSISQRRTTACRKSRFYLRECVGWFCRRAQQLHAAAVRMSKKARSAPASVRLTEFTSPGSVRASLRTNVEHAICAVCFAKPVPAAYSIFLQMRHQLLLLLRQSQPVSCARPLAQDR